MNRNFLVVTLCLLTLGFSAGGCKKGASVGKDPQKSAESEVTAPTKPDLPSAAAPAGEAEKATVAKTEPTSAQATPPPKAKPAVNTNASVMVMCYHDLDDTSKISTSITTAEFEKQMQQIKDAGFTVIHMQDFLAWRRGEKSIPEKSCIITIDDGWVSGYTKAWPILKKFNYPFTMFIYVRFVGSGGKSMTWAQLAEMRDGGVDIQSHTYSHSNLKQPGGGVDARNKALILKDLAELGREGWMRKEIVESKKELEQQLGIKVNALAYPFGIHSQEARAMVKEAGYEAAFTVYGQRLTHTSQYDLLGRYAYDKKSPKNFQNALAMIGGGGEPAPDTQTVGQFAAASMITQPMDKETINTPTPILKANLTTMGDVENGSVEIRLSGVGPVKVQYDPNTKMVTAPITTPLKPGSYTVILSARVGGQRREARWDFTVGTAAKPGATPAAGQ